jgi:hypothetical protein
MLGAILGAHSSCICPPESQFMTDFLHVSVEPAPRLARIVADRRFRTWGDDVEDLRRELAAVTEPYSESLLRLVRRYAGRVRRPGATVWIDHTPRHSRHAAVLAEMFPAARFIHIVRDGRGTAASVLPISWGPNTIESAAHWWVELLAHGLALESWGGTRVMRVRYEDVLADPEATVRALAAFAGLPYEPGMLSGDGYRLPPDPTRLHVLIGQPPQHQRAQAWAESLTPRQIEIFEWVAGDMLRYLGYELRFGSRARPPSVIERWSARIRERIAFAVNRWRDWRRRRRHVTMLEARRPRPR